MKKFNQEQKSTLNALGLVPSEMESYLKYKRVKRILIYSSIVILFLILLIQ